ETLAVRIRQHNENAEKIANFLESHPKVSWVHYPKSKSYPQQELAAKYLPNGASGVLSLAIKGGKENSIKFMDALQLVNIVTHVAFSQSCILHPASHTHRQLTDEQLRAAGVNPELIRLSVGIENVDDILADLEQALDKV
ncbi:MAG TPA: PLP-dependent transferase, partial [Chitinophagales bacterium]|nr:PLP-dependent transferase [Chitinophagales bacterium]